MTHIYLESFGVKLDIEVQDELLVPSVETILPPGWQPLDAFPEDGHITLTGSASQYDVLVDGSALSTGLTRELAIHVLDAQIRTKVALLAPEHVFVHAGVVVLNGRAILLPGPSFAGKTTLVAALVSCGATYYSDEFAALDGEGLVHAYPRPLSMRSEDEQWSAYMAPDELGASTGGPPVRPALIVDTRFVPGARWKPRVCSRGVGALALLAQAVPTHQRSEATVNVVGEAAKDATTLNGDRGEAAETAPLLVAALEEAARGAVS